MTIALSLVLALGLIWFGIGIVLSMARHRHCPIMPFYAIGCIVAVIGSWIQVAHQGVTLDLARRECRIVLLWIAIAAIMNALAQAAYMYSLSFKEKALAFAIPQTAFIIPFAFSAIFWNERVTIASVSGIACIACGALIAGSKEAGSSSKGLVAGGLLLSVLTALTIGVSQIALVVPSHMLRDSSDEAMAFRTPVMLSVSLLVYIAGALVSQGGRLKLNATTL